MAYQKRSSGLPHDQRTSLPVPRRRCANETLEAPGAPTLAQQEAQRRGAEAAMRAALGVREPVVVEPHSTPFTEVLRAFAAAR